MSENISKEELQDFEKYAKPMPGMYSGSTMNPLFNRLATGEEANRLLKTAQVLVAYNEENERYNLSNELLDKETLTDFLRRHQSVFENLIVEYRQKFDLV